MTKTWYRLGTSRVLSVLEISTMTVEYINPVNRDTFITHTKWVYKDCFIDMPVMWTVYSSSGTYTKTGSVPLIELSDEEHRDVEIAVLLNDRNPL